MATNGYKFSFWSDENVLELGDGDSGTVWGIY